MNGNTLINATRLMPACCSRRLAAGAVVVVVLLAPLASQGQHYRMRDGQMLAANTVVVRGNQLVRALEVKDGASAEVGYPLSGVVALDWPEPEELRRAQENFVKGAIAEALADAETVATRFSPFSALPGSWWGEAELLRLQALASLGRWNEVEPAARRLSEKAPAERLRQAARLLVAKANLRERRWPEAKAILESLGTLKPIPALEAEIAVLRGELALQESDWEGALEAFLQVPAFHPTQAALMPPALLGSANAYRRLGDAGRAERTLLELVDHYPESAEAKQSAASNNGL